MVFFLVIVVLIVDDYLREGVLDIRITFWD